MNNLFKVLKGSCYIETGHLISVTNQRTGFYVLVTLTLNRSTTERTVYPNPFHATDPFLYPMKILENEIFFNVFRV